MLEVLLLLLAYALMLDWLLKNEVPVPVARRVVLRLIRRGARERHFRP